MNRVLTATSGKLLYFLIKASPYLKPGDVVLKVTNLDFITKENSQKYSCKDQTLTLHAKAESTATLSVSGSSHYGTCVLPFAVSPLPDGVKAYSAKGLDETGQLVVLSEVTQLAAYTPYILYSASGYSGSLSGPVDANKYGEVVSDGLLRGAFVQCPKDNGIINFVGDNRLTQTGRDKKMNSQMQKVRMEGQFDVQRQIVNLTLSDGTTTDKTRVVFNPDKKAGYERDCDAAKFESNGASELYSVEALAGRLAINERPEGSVKIGYRAAKAGEYTIAAQRMDRQVLLRDNDLQITFDLTQGDYHFTSDAGEFDNRFMLLIDNSTTGIGDIVTTTGVNVKPTDSGLNISNLQGKTLHVYALNGALYATRTQDGFLGLAKGVYLVEVEGLKAKFMVR